MTTTAEAIRIYTFPPGFGLPTTGPMFLLKLAMALRMADVPYELCTGDLHKSPKRSIPWIEVGTVAMADSALVLHWLAETRGVDLERGLTSLQRAHGLALRVLLEEHWHQIFEYELILAPRRWCQRSRYARALPAPPLRARDAPTHARRDCCVRQGGPRRRRHLARGARLGSGRSPHAHGLQRLGLARTVDSFTVPDTVHVTCPRAPPHRSFRRACTRPVLSGDCAGRRPRALTTRTPLALPAAMAPDSYLAR